MSNEVVKGRGGLWRMVEVGGIAAAAGGFFLIGLHHPSPTFTNLHRPPVADIHTEYVKFPSGRDTITAYLAYPERKDPAPVVVVIHEIFGMSDFIRQTTEQLAKDGFVAIAPDLLSRRDRKSTRLNSSHSQISYAVFCLKKKKPPCQRRHTVADP